MAVGLIVDTDPGVDDAFALAVAAHSPELELRAVTTVFGNVDLATTTDNAGRVLGLLGRREVPVGRGADRPLVHPTTRRAEHVHGDDGLGGTADAFGPVGDGPAGRALDVMARVLETTSEPVVLAAIGPLTNVALLLASRPDLADRIGRLIVMGGALGEGGNVTMGAEFNVWSDPEAARRVLVEERVPTTLVPLDLTHIVTVDEPWLDAVGASGPVGRALAGTRAPYLAHYGRRLGAPRIAIHDAVALLEAAVPGTLATTALTLEVDTSLGPARGVVLGDRRPAGVDDPPAHRVEVALPTGTDADTVRDGLFRRLTGT